MPSHYDRFAARSPEWLLGWRILELLRIVPYRTLLLMFATLSATGVVMDNPKFPLERRVVTVSVRASRAHLTRRTPAAKAT